LGNLADWLAAVATFAAVLAALGVAASDRYQRKKERENADKAQARLVLLAADLWPQREHTPTAYFRLSISNFGLLGILDVEFESAALTTRPGSSGELTDPDDERIIPIIKPDHQSMAGETFDFRPMDGAGQPASLGEPFLNGETWAFPMEDPTMVSATIRFIDANGNHWRKSTSGSLVRI
jgi:hypothetical protein